ncbi:MAG: glycoside hydrolase family 2 protein, partial [Acholeplasmataceae bacterium]|nr:glycoside hydrolase family 2 protein [Acholeplasmataceae bacterium]
MRIRRSLNFNWRFTPDYRDAYLKPDFDPANFESVMLPHSLIELPFNYINDEAHQFVGTYFLDFTIDKPEKSQMMLLRFYGVMNTCTVYLNGKEIGSHKGGYTPFDLVLEDDLVLDQTNRLVVVVDGRETANVPPFGGVVDYLGHSGIYREAELQIIPKTHIRHLRIKPFEPSSLMESQIVINYEFDLDGPLLFPLEAKVVVSDQDKTLHQESSVFKNGDQLAGGFLLDDICRWSPESPKLYHLELSLSHDGKIIDSVKERFGCRTVKFTPEGFTINNRRLKLIGLNRHQSYPYVGYAMPKRMQELDAEILRNELGVNIVRTSHYMQSDHFIARADELGLLVFEEIPGWQHLGDEEFKTLSLANLKTMINHHFNHPSIIMWGVRINESQDDNTFYLETNRIARELDETRPTGGVRNFAGSELLEDVYTYNDFTHTGANQALASPSSVAKALV